MFKFNNTHIFTNYLKQLLASVSIPTCKIYTKEFAKYFEIHGEEDPRVVESINTLGKSRKAIRVNYLKDDNLYNYFWKNPLQDAPAHTFWLDNSKALFMGNNEVDGLTKTFKSSGNIYDSRTHNYLGDFLRFLRDYHDINLMSLYNCFDNKVYNNIYLKIPQNTVIVEKELIPGVSTSVNKVVFPEITLDSNDPNYRIYAIPVKLFSDYTIAIDSSQGIELFCGFYGTKLDTSSKAQELLKKTYKKYQKTNFNQPFLYDCLNVKYWNRALESSNLVSSKTEYIPTFLSSTNISRWDILNKEQDLKLFIKVPTSCRSSIVILEGDYLNYNDFLYKPEVKLINNSEETLWDYKQNTLKINFQANKTETSYIDPSTELITNTILKCELPDLNERPFKPISKLQLLLLNTGESYPFADRLVEYLTGSAITTADEIPDNIKRAQKVMSKNGYYFNISGLWEPKMQKIAYDYIMNTGPIEAKDLDNDGVKETLVDARRGLQPTLGHNSKSSLYDTLGFIDKDVEKWYASWKLLPRNIRGQTFENDLISTVTDTIQNTDIYNGLYNIE